MKKRLFIKNAVILTTTAIILRTIGIFFRIYISNAIGSEGMGLHQLIFSVYTFASAIASSGISIAVTRLVSEKIDSGGKLAVNKILSRALCVSIFLGFLSCALMFFGAEFVSANWLGDMRACLSLKILSLGLPFMAVSSCLKGYFIARRKTSTPSNSQLFEQLVRIVTCMLLLKYTGTKNLAYACAAVVCGNAVSELAAFLYIYIGYLRDKRTLSKGTSEPTHVLRSLSAIFVPVALGSYLNTILHSTENILVPDALTRYTFSRSLSLSQFGTLKGMALPLLFFPSSFLGALSTLLIPEISQYAQNRQNKSLKNTIEYTLLITSVSSILIGIIFWVYSGEIGRLIYKNDEVGAYMKMLAPIVPFMYIESIIAGILNALNQQNTLLRYNVYNSAIRITLITFFVPKFGVYFFIAIMLASNIFTSSLSIFRLVKVTNITFNIKAFIIKPLVSALMSFLILYALKALLHNIFNNSILELIAGIFVICITYTSFILMTNCVTENDVRRLLGRKRG